MVADQIKIFSCRSSHYLAQEMANKYGQELADVSFFDFSDGEFQVVINESVRGQYVFIIQSTFPPQENLMELLVMIDAAKRASAKYVTAVIPYFGWARQDRKDQPRVSITAKLVANLLMASGVDRVMTMDLHAGQIQGFFDIPLDHLNASAVFIPYIQKQRWQNLTFASPDVGGSKRARNYAKYFGADFVMCDKSRSKANQIASMTLIGNVEYKDVLLVDDMVDTAGTLCSAAEVIMEKGAKSVRAICTHPVLSGPAYERLSHSKLEQLIVSNTIPLKEKSDKIKVLSVADIFATCIRNAHEHKSINSLFLTQSV